MNPFRLLWHYLQPVPKLEIPLPMKILDHWCDEAERIPLPGRGTLFPRRFLVWHFTGGATGRSSIESMKNAGLSAQFVVERNGEIIQTMPCNQKAYHAGRSQWKDPKTGILYKNLNDHSIGIEIANAGDDPGALSWARKQPGFASIRATHRDESTEREWEVFPPAQLNAVEALSITLVRFYNLDDAIGHEDISRGRKTDPGPAFPMARMRRACGFPEVIAHS